jgi:DNA-binding transcriptional ArsR family regulator
MIRETPMRLDRLSATFSALAHPARRSMLARLSRGQATVQELARPLRMSPPAVSKHLKVLERGGLISRSKDAQWRPCRLEAQPLREADDWIAQYRQEWEQRFDRLEAYLKQIQAPSPTPAAKPPRQKGKP